MICYENVLGINKNDAEAWNGKSIALANLSRYNEALTCLDNALTIDQNFKYAWLNKAWIFLLQKNPCAAQACLNAPVLQNDSDISHQVVTELYHFARKGQCQLFKKLDEHFKQPDHSHNTTQQLEIYVLAGKFFIKYGAVVEAETCLKKGFTLPFQRNNPQLKALKENLARLQSTPLKTISSSTNHYRGTFLGSAQPKNKKRKNLHQSGQRRKTFNL